MVRKYEILLANKILITSLLLGIWHFWLLFRSKKCLCMIYSVLSILALLGFLGFFYIFVLTVQLQNYFNVIFFNQKGIWNLRDGSKFLCLQQYKGETFNSSNSRKYCKWNEKEIYTVHQTCSHRCAFLMLKYPCEFLVSHNVMGDNKFWSYPICLQS